MQASWFRIKRVRNHLWIGFICEINMKFAGWKISLCIHVVHRIHRLSARFTLDVRIHTVKHFTYSKTWSAGDTNCSKGIRKQWVPQPWCKLPHYSVTTPGTGGQRQSHQSSERTWEKVKMCRQVSCSCTCIEIFILHLTYIPLNTGYTQCTHVCGYHTLWGYTH